MIKAAAILVCLGVCLGSVLFDPVERDPTPLAELDWLAGRWVMEGEGQYIEESWSPARHDAMVGMLRWARGGKVWLYELMSIEVEEDQLVLRIRHFNRKLEPWKSEADGPLRMPMLDYSEDRVVFENPVSDDPRRIVYERAGDQLSIQLENAAGEATQRFRMKRDG